MNEDITIKRQKAYAQSTAAALAQDADIDTIKETVESMPTVLSTQHGTNLWEKRRGIFK